MVSKINFLRQTIFLRLRRKLKLLLAAVVFVRNLRKMGENKSKRGGNRKRIGKKSKRIRLSKQKARINCVISCKRRGSWKSGRDSSS